MSRAVSPSNGRAYGLDRVCRIWGMARARVYRHRKPQAERQRRGPVGPMSDVELIEEIRTVLAASPFHGEGHRKVWAGLRMKGLRTHCAGVAAEAGERPAGAIRTARRADPQTAKQRSFRTPSTPVGHGHDHRLDPRRTHRGVRGGGSPQCQCVGIHASRHGTRFEALEPLRQGVREHFGGFSQGIASGLWVRHDHGSEYMSRAFQEELRFLGIESSPALVQAPEEEWLCGAVDTHAEGEPAVGAPLRDP